MPYEYDFHYIILYNDASTLHADSSTLHADTLT